MEQGGRQYIVSCFHVLFGRELEDGIREVTDQSQVIDPDVVCPCFKDGGKDDAKIGSVAKGILTSELDLGLAMINNSLISNMFDVGRTIRAPRELTGEDAIKGLEVKSWGRISEKRGTVEAIKENSVPIIYLPKTGKEFTHNVDGLIRTTCISKPGDSGSVATDMDGNAIGIIIAGDPDIDVTYIIPINKVLNNNKFKKLSIV